MINRRNNPKLVLFLVKIISRKVTFSSNTFSASSTLLSNMADSSEQGVHDQLFDRYVPFPK